MLFLSPAYFSLLIFIALFILMYFFRKKYERLVVPSNFLWEEAMKEQTASPYLKKLQKNLLFFLQLFILLFLLILLVQPIWQQEKIIASEVVFVMDLSASMDREEHWQQTKELALDTLQKVDSAKITLVEAGATPKIVFYQETDKNVVEDYLQKVELHYGTEQKESTFALVKTLIDSNSAPIFIFSDDVSKEETRKTFMTNPVYVFNSKLKNSVSITNFVVSKQNEETVGFVSMQNYLEEDNDVQLFVYENDELTQQVDISLSSNETKGFTLNELNEADYYEVELVVDDSYLVDNRMYFVPTNTLEEVYIQKDIHSFVQKAVQTIYPISQIIEDDTIVNDGIVVTNEFLPNANQPFIYMHKGQEKVTIDSKETIMKDDFLLNYVDLEEVLIVGAYNDLTMNPLEVIVSNKEIPLIAKGKTMNQVPFVVVNFDIADSDWPLHISFPVFFYNAITYLKDEQLYSNLVPNEEIVVTTTDKVTIFDETSKAVSTFNPGIESVVAPSKPGIYQLNYGNNVQFFSVNIENAERNVSFGEDFVWNENVQQENEEVTTTTNSYIRLFIIFVFMLLLVEWGVHIRGNRI